MFFLKFIIIQEEKYLGKAALSDYSTNVVYHCSSVLECRIYNCMKHMEEMTCCRNNNNM
jgi:hypothetical protein